MKTQNSEARDKLRILIVDDIAGQRETLADFLREKGYDPVPAPDGASAVESVKAGPFAAAILDIKLPDTSGEKLAGRLKELNPDLEIILITGYASVETAIGAVRAGVSAYLTKPLDMDLLLADLERALEHRRLILENRQLLEKLRESEARFREMAELMPETIYELDEKGKIVFTNKKGRDNFGYTAEELETDLTAPQMFIPEDRERAKKNMGKVLGGEEVRDAEYAALRKDGSVFPVLTYSLPIRRGNRIAGVRGVMVDITNRKRMEEDLLKLQKLESVGILAGGIAHDFNNILTTILGNISFIRNSLDPESEEHEALSAAEEGCREGRNLTHQLLTFSRGGEPVKETIVIANLLRSGVSFVLRGSNVRPSFQLASDLRPVEADPGQIHQALSNIIINADHAMPDGGTITVKAENVTVTPEDHLPLEKGGYILISIKDTGIGIQKKHLAKIFDPYFTTKPKGSGLGLAGVFSIIKNHGGYVTAESEPGSGTTFFIYLPASDKEIAARREAGGEVITGTGRILLMDDDETIRNVATRLLERLGYEVDSATDGREAITKYREAEKAGTPFDIVILDLTVPGGMGGVETLEKLKEIDPGVKAIVSSGYSTESEFSEYEKFGFRDAIAKPYRMSDLSMVLHRTQIHTGDNTDPHR